MSRESKILIGVLLGVVVVMGGLFFLANQGSTPTAVGDKTKVVRDTSHKTGSGPVQVVEFGDYQCPACGAAEPAVEQLLKDDAALVTFYFRNFPLVTIHPNANNAALAAEAAGGQGNDKFWAYHNKLYATQSEWSNKTDPYDNFVSYATGLGLDVNAFKTAYTDKKYQPVIDQDVADGNALGVNATPTFFINGVKYEGKNDYASLSAAVKAAAGQATASPAASASPAEATPAQ